MARKNPHAVALGRRGGRVKSAAKTAAARLNGAKGGHPRKVKEETDVDQLRRERQTPPTS